MKAASSKKASLRRWIWRAGVSISLLSLILAEGVPITTCFIRTFQVERQHQNAMQGVRASAEQKARSIHHYREFGYPIIASLALFSIAFFAFMGCGARSAISGTSRRWSLADCADRVQQQVLGHTQTLHSEDVQAPA